MIRVMECPPNQPATCSQANGKLEALTKLAKADWHSKINETDTLEDLQCGICHELPSTYETLCDVADVQDQDTGRSIAAMSTYLARLASNTG